MIDPRELLPNPVFVAGAEVVGLVLREHRCAKMQAQAEARSAETGLPILVIPEDTRLPEALAEHPDASAIVYVDGAIDRCSDPHAAYDEVVRVAGSEANVFVHYMQPWTWAHRLHPNRVACVESAPPDGPFKVRMAGTLRPDRGVR